MTSRGWFTRYGMVYEVCGRVYEVCGGFMRYVAGL